MKKGHKRQKPQKTPSRERYEKANPTVSARIPVATRDKLLASLEALNMSLPEALKVLAGEMEVKTKPIEEARKEGLSAGFRQARSQYMVTFPCSECGKPIAITEPKIKAEIVRYMSKSRWKHSQCP